MILNGKAKEDFEKWYFENHCSSNIKFEDLLPHHIYDVFGWLYKQSLTIQNAFVIDWFDSIDIYVNVLRYSLSEPNKWVVIKSLYENNLDFIYSSRQQATIQAIKKANDLYNSRYENV